jgi:hypothetical protein
MKSHRQIQAEIDKLRDMKPTVLRASFFGDNHHDAIDAQIEVLEDELIDDDDIYNNLDDGTWAQNVADAALEARAWRDDEEEKDFVPSESWKELVR